VNNENKKLISQSRLLVIVYNYIKPELDKCYSSGGDWDIFSMPDVFAWDLSDGVGNRNRNIGARLRNDHWVIFNNCYYIEEHVNIKIFNDHVEFIEDSEFDDFDHDFMYDLYMKIKEVVENVTVSNESNNESVIENRPISESDNKHVYLLTIDACCDISSYVYLIKATNKDEAFEIFWNRYKDFPEADIDADFGTSDPCDDYSSIQKLHKEKFVRINENTMESKEEVYSITSIKLYDAPKGVHIDDDIAYILQIY
jgi:hypothetical protein